MPHNCPECGFQKWVKTDKVNTETGIPKWACGRCGAIVDGYRHPVRQAPKVLYLDIETSLTELRNFGTKVPSGYLSYKMIKRPFFIICWAAAWVTDKNPRVISGAVTGCEAKRRCDKRHLQDLWTLMNDADYVVGHNAKGFDIKKVETRFLINNAGRITASRARGLSSKKL